MYYDKYPMVSTTALMESEAEAMFRQPVIVPARCPTSLLLTLGT